MASLVDQRPTAVIGLATGSSPEPVYEELARRHDAGELELAGIRAFLLDEYVGLGVGHPAAYRTVIRTRCVDPLGLDPTVSPDRMATPRPTGGHAGPTRRPSRRPGGVDLQLLGIGGDGHIGFNEPGSSLGSRTRLKTLTAQTRSDNARFFDGREDHVPTHVLTQGSGPSPKPATWCSWPGAQARRRPSPVASRDGHGHGPASVLQLHPHVSIVIDDDAAKDLTLADYYPLRLRHQTGLAGPLTGTTPGGRPPDTGPGVLESTP